LIENPIFQNASTNAAIFPRESETPFGFPVEPDVKSITAYLLSDILFNFKHELVNVNFVERHYLLYLHINGVDVFQML